MRNNLNLSLLRFILIWVALLGSRIGSAQELSTQPKAYTHTIGAGLYQGFVIKHDLEMGHLAQGMTRGFEVFYNQNTYGKNAWEQVFGYPDIGFSLAYFDYGAPQLGESVGLFGYADFYLKRSEFVEAILKVGTGLGYHTRPYHRETNNQNVAIGSPFTMSMQLRAGLNFNLTERIKLNTSVTASHFSIAAYKQPNKGANAVTFNTGLSYRLESEKPDYLFDMSSFEYDRGLKHHIAFYYALKEIPPIGGDKYPVYVISYYINKQVSNTNILNLGLDGFNNTAVREEILRNETLQDNHPDHKRVGLTFGHELKLSRISMLTQLGVYLYRPHKTDQPIYQRYGINVELTDNLFFHWGFLTHYAKADHTEFGLGLIL